MANQVDEMLSAIRRRVSVNYMTCPPYVGTDIPDFIGCVAITCDNELSNGPFRGNVKFATVIGTKPAYIEEHTFVGTVASFYQGLKSRGYVSKRNITISSLPLQLYVYESQVSHFS